MCLRSLDEFAIAREWITLLDRLGAPANPQKAASASSSCGAGEVGATRLPDPTTRKSGSKSKDVPSLTQSDSQRLEMTR